MAIPAPTRDLFDLQTAFARERKAFVYVVSAGPSMHKIGVATDIKKRMKHLQISTPENLSIVHAEPVHDCDDFAVETRAHRLLESRWVRGEWFAVSATAARLAVEAGARTLMRGEVLRIDVAAPNRRHTHDGIATLLNRGVITGEQCAAALRYRSAMDAKMEALANGARPRLCGRGAGKVVRFDRDKMEDFCRWEEAIGLEHGASGVLMLREVAGAGSALRSNLASAQRRSGRSPKRFASILATLEEVQAGEREALAA